MKRSILILVALLCGCSPAEPDNGQVDAAPSWELRLQRTNYPARDTGVAFIFRDQYWLSNGWAHGLTFRDLWRSDDGLSWRLVSSATPYDPYSAITEFNGRLYAMNNSVWVSDDGESWTRILDQAPFADDREEGGLFVIDQRLVFVGPNGVWASPDGVSWEALAENPPYAPRHGYASLYFNDRLWVLSGHAVTPNDPAEKRNPGWTSFADVWWSEDGREWHRAEAPWSPRTWLTAIVHEDRAYLVGGLDNVNGRNIDETWVSDDGLSWSRLDVTETFGPARHWPMLWSHNGRLLLATGNAWPVLNDVWELREAGNAP